MFLLCQRIDELAAIVLKFYCFVGDILVERCDTVTAVPVVFPIGKQVHHLAGLYHQVGHMIDEDPFFFDRQSVVWRQNEDVPVRVLAGCAT